MFSSVLVFAVIWFVLVVVVLLACVDFMDLCLSRVFGIRRGVYTWIFCYCVDFVLGFLVLFCGFTLWSLYSCNYCREALGI